MATPETQMTEAGELARWLIADLRTNHAGETGAVEIYRGILAVTRDEHLIAFARQHMETELSHLGEISVLLPASQRSLLLPLWRMLGWLTGAIAALLGRDATFTTIEAVETFVDRHYQAQIDRLRQENSQPAIMELLDRLRRDEVEHRNDAMRRRTSEPARLVKAWTWLVDGGSRVAVYLARLM
jgi:ubiquinone biosynthesis monooxygenase Coq7